MSALTSSPYYPYEKLHSFGTMENMGKLPYIVRQYLMDMPSAGYTPPDNNEYPRCALMKYLYYDTARPLDNPVPTPQQKLSIVFDPAQSETPPTDKNYRIYTQQLIGQAQTNGATIMRITMGRVRAPGAFESVTGIDIAFLTNYAYEANTRTIVASRTFEMACLAQTALAGINVEVGVGTICFNSRVLTECGITPITDEYMNVGYRLTMALSNNPA
jgi:hypothetical protein